MGTNFRGKSEKALKINFRFVTAASPGRGTAALNDDVIDTSARDLLCY